MKKETLAIIIIIILMSLVFGVQETKAASLGGQYELTKDITKLHQTDVFDDRLDNYNSFCSEYSKMDIYYACGLSGSNINNFQVITWNDPDIKIITFAYRNTNGIDYMPYYIYNPNNSDITFYETYYELTGSVTQTIKNNKYSIYQFGTNSAGMNESAISLSDDTFHYLAKTNTHIYFWTDYQDIIDEGLLGRYLQNTSLTSFWTDGKYYKTIKMNGEVYENGDVIFISAPSISFSVKNNTETIDGEEYITSKDLTVDFGYIDNTKYMYQISLDDGENWQTYTLTQSTSTTLEITNNLTVIARVLEIEDNSYVTSSTFTITEIINPNVTISFYKYDNPNCTANFKNEEVEICNDLDIIFSYVNFEKYKYQYSIDNGNTFIDINKTEDNKFNYVLNYEYLIVRVLNKNTDELITSASYTFSKYNEIPQEPFINFAIYYNFTSCDSTGTICDDFKLISPPKYQELKNDDLIKLKNVSATLAVQVFNYREDYHYYFSDNSNIYENHEITDFKKSEFGYYYSAIETDFNMTIVVDIYNNTNEYVSSYSFTITQLPTNEEDDFSVSSILDYFKNISNNDNNLFYYINEVYKKIRNSKIGPYILIVIVSSIIILIIKSLKRS